MIGTKDRAATAEGRKELKTISVLMSQLKEGHQEISFPCICSLIKKRKVAVSTTHRYGNI